MIEGENKMAKEQNKNEDKKVDINVGKIDLPKLDLTKYVGKKAKILTAEVFMGTFGYYAKVQTEVLETIGSKDNTINIQASKLLGLQKDADGVVGFGDNTKTGLFMAKYKANTLKDLIGKQVLLQIETNKDGQEYLTFA